MNFFVSLLSVLALAAPLSAVAGPHPDRACFDWLAKYITSQEAAIGHPEILPYGDDPKIAMDDRGDISANRAVCNVAADQKAGHLTYTEITRNSIEPTRTEPGANTYFNLKIYRNASGRLVRATIRAPQHNHGAVDKYDDYVVEFESTTNSSCAVKRVLGDSAWNPIETPYGPMHVVADRKACEEWAEHGDDHAATRGKKKKTRDRADRWIDSWKNKHAPWMKENDNAFVLEAMDEQCGVLAEFIVEKKKFTGSAGPAGRKNRSGGGAKAGQTTD